MNPFIASESQENRKSLKYLVRLQADHYRRNRPFPPKSSGERQWKYNAPGTDPVSYTHLVADIKKKNFDKQALSSAISFNSDPYQSSETGNMIMTVFVPVAYDSQIRILYVSIMIEQLRKLGVYELLQGKISVHLLKVDSENFITCISSNEDTTCLLYTSRCV